MLTIHNLPGSKYYIDEGATSASTAYYSFYIDPFFGPYEQNGDPCITEDIVRIPGFITKASQPNDLGDKTCYHRDFDGDIVLPPFQSTYEVDPRSCNAYYSTRVGAWLRTYSHIAPEGTDLFESYPVSKVSDPPLKNEGYGLLTLRIINSGGVVGRGYGFEGKQFNGSVWIDQSYGSLTLRRKDSNSLTWQSGSTSIQFTSYNDFFGYSPSKFQPFRTSSYLSRISPNYYSYDVAFLRNINQNYMLDIFPTMGNDDENEIGLLGKRCVDQFEFTNVNSLGFISELRKIGDLIPKFSGFKDPSTYASLWLWFKYGLNLTISDTKKLAQSIASVRDTANAVPTNTKYSSSSHVNLTGKRKYFSTYHYKVCAERWPRGLMKIVGDARRWNLWPKLENAWDMIPLSFVVDWVADIQSLLSSLDVRTDVQYLNILGTCWSWKHELSVPARELFGQLPLLGTVKFTKYDRVVEQHVRLPRLKIEQSSGFSNWAELTSLIVVKK